MIYILEILTALGNNNLYKKIKNIKEFNLYKNDIQYREGIIELLKNNNNFDLIIIYEKIPGEISFEELINKIKIINNEIKIIFILENKNEFLENILMKKNIKNIFYNNRINFEEFILRIKNINYSEKDFLKEENKKLKEIIFKKNEQINNFEKINYKNIKNKIIKLLIISEFDFYEFKKIKNELKNKLNHKDFLIRYKIEYLDLNKLNKKIKYAKNLIFIVNSDFEEIKKIIKKINLIKIKHLINNKKINFIFIGNKINLKILKNIFKNYNILGKIKLKKNNYLINNKLIKNINKIN